MPLNNDLLVKLKDHCPTETKSWLEALDDDTVIVTLQDLLDDNPPIENYVMLGVLFEICHYRHDEEDPSSKGLHGASKKTKKDYNRIFEFGCLSGATFAVITKTEGKSMKMLEKHTPKVAIGQVFAIWEPRKNKLGSTLRPNMPVIEADNPIWPFHDTAITQIPRIIPRDPAVGGEATFFLLHHQLLQFGACYVRGPHDIYPPSCGGITCDRAGEQLISRACGCLRYNDIGKIAPIVMEYTVRFDDGKKNVTVPKQRSFRTTKFFMVNVDTAGLKMELIDNVEKIRAIRNKVKQMQTFIHNGSENFKGGFTIAATITRGMVQDYSDPSARVLSTDGTYKICFLMPSDWKEVKEDNAYKALKFNLQHIIPDVEALANGGANLDGNSSDNAIEIPGESTNDIVENAPLTATA